MTSKQEQDTIAFFRTLTEIKWFAEDASYQPVLERKDVKENPTKWLKHQIQEIRKRCSRACKLLPSLYSHTRSGTVYNTTLSVDPEAI